MDRSIRWFTHLQDELHSVDPEADTHIKIMPTMFTQNYRSHGIDFEALTELTSMIGDDAQAVSGPHFAGDHDDSWVEDYSYHWHELGVAYDFMESVAPNKIHVNSESHFLSTSNFRDLYQPPEYVYSVYWLATLMGMDANMGWFWARDPDGSPEDRLEGELNFFDPALAGSYAASVNMQPRIANETTQVMLDLNSVSEHVMALREQRRPLRIFYSETTAINIDGYMTHQEHLHESLFFEGFPIGYATQRIIENQDNNLWDAVLISNTDYVTDAEFAAVQTYLDQGGTVLIHGDDSLTMNQYGMVRRQQLRSGSGTMIRLPSNSSDEDIRAAALGQVAASMPALNLTQHNAAGEQTRLVHWRSVEQEDGRHLLNAFNLGREAVTINLSIEGGQALRVTDVMTGNSVGTTISLEPMAVLLAEVASAR